MGRGLAVVFAFFGLIACGDGSIEPVRQQGDTTFVHSAAPLRNPATLREILRIGSLEGPPEYSFDRISMVAVAPDGDIFVAQVDGELRRYDGDGRFVSRIAGVGEGPGEVRYVVGMDVAPDGQLAVLDFGNNRVSVYAPNGEFVRQIRRPIGRPGYGRDAVRWGPGGGLWLAIHPPRVGPDTLGTRPRPIFGRLVDDGEIADTVYLPLRGWDGCERRRPGFARGFFEDARLPYSPFAQWSRGADGVLVFGCAAAYSIDVVAPAGGVLRLSRDWQPPVMSDDERDFYALMQRASTGRPRPRFDVPRERPAFLRVWAGEGGRFWLWPGSTGVSRDASEQQREMLAAMLSGASAPTRLWDYWSPTDGLDVFNSEGRWIGRVETPESWDGDPFPGIADPTFRHDTIWAVTKDELDLRYVSKFVVEWPDTD